MVDLVVNVERLVVRRALNQSLVFLAVRSYEDVEVMDEVSSQKCLAHWNVEKVCQSVSCKSWL